MWSLRRRRLLPIILALGFALLLINFQALDLFKGGWVTLYDKSVNSDVEFYGQNPFHEQNQKDFITASILANRAENFTTTKSTGQIRLTTVNNHQFVTTLDQKPARNICVRDPPPTVDGDNEVGQCPDMKTAEQRHQTVKLGGEWYPDGCTPAQRLAIIIPYRDRRQHLIRLLDNLHPFLQRQKLHYKIFVVEQLGNDNFNKGKLMNTAYMYAKERFNMDCVVFNDVDLIPINDRNSYQCKEKPQHLSAAIDVFEFKVAYSILIGGVLNFRPDVFEKANGYSNLYWGWGSEDDDMFFRLKYKNITVEHQEGKDGRYVMLKHFKEHNEKGYLSRYKLFLHNIQQYSVGRYQDGLHNPNTSIEWTHEHQLYTHIMVNVGPQPPFRNDTTTEKLTV